MDKAKSSLYIEEGYEDAGGEGGGALNFCVCTREL